MPLGLAPGTLSAHIDIPPELAGSLVVLAISIVIVLIVWKARGAHSGFAKHRGTVVKPGAPFHSCGMEAKWMLPQGYWHCDRCNVAVTETPPAAMAPPAVHAAIPQSAQCPTCFGPGRWIPESNAWGCDRCRALIPAPPPR